MTLFYTLANYSRLQYLFMFFLVKISDNSYIFLCFVHVWHSDIVTKSDFCPTLFYLTRTWSGILSTERILFLICFTFSIDQRTNFEFDFSYYSIIFNGDVTASLCNSTAFLLDLGMAQSSSILIGEHAIMQYRDW